MSSLHSIDIVQHRKCVLYHVRLKDLQVDPFLCSQTDVLFVPVEQLLSNSALPWLEYNKQTTDCSVELLLENIQVLLRGESACPVACRGVLAAGWWWSFCGTLQLFDLV